MRLPWQFGMIVLISFLVSGCGSDTRKKEVRKLDRQLIGAELEFGKDAAEYDLWREAIFRWEKVAGQDPQNSEARNNLAVAYESIGDYESAKQMYETAVELDEDSTQIRNNYKRFMSFYKRHQRQIERERQTGPTGSAATEKKEEQQ